MLQKGHQTVDRKVPSHHTILIARVSSFLCILSALEITDCDCTYPKNINRLAINYNILLCSTKWLQVLPGYCNMQPFFKTSEHLQLASLEATLLTSTVASTSIVPSSYFLWLLWVYVMILMVTHSLMYSTLINMIRPIIFTPITSSCTPSKSYCIK